MCVCARMCACVCVHISIYRNPSAVSSLSGFLHPVSSNTFAHPTVAAPPWGRGISVVARKVSGGEGRKAEGARDGVKPVCIPEVLCNRSSGVMSYLHRGP